MQKQRSWDVGASAVIAVIASVAAFATPSSAFAFDWKHMPASACLLEQSTGWLNYGEYSWLMTNSGGITVTGYGTIPSQTPAKIGCPVIRDVLQNTNGVAGLTAHVNDISSTKQIYCTAYAVSDTQTIVQQVGPVSSGVSFSGGYKQLNMNLTQSPVWGMYHVICFIEPALGQTLHSIGWAEHGGDGF